MVHDSCIVIPATGVKSLCWIGDQLVDWVAGGQLYDLDGSKHERHVAYAYRFDSSVISPSGRYAVLYERLGTKGLILDRGKVLREINRSYYYATAYEYPIVLFALFDGREVIAHCPDDYNKIDIEELASGKRLTVRDTKEAEDFFHSRLAVNITSTKLLSAGWIWHPFDTISIYDIERALNDPTSLDRLGQGFANLSSEINSAAFSEAQMLVMSSARQSDDWNEDELKPRVKPGTIGAYDLDRQSYLSVAPVEEIVGAMMPLGSEYVIGFYEHPKVIHLESGRIVHRWPELRSGRQNSSILWHDDIMPLPPIALDPANRRFAVAGDKTITVITTADLNSEE